jgi:hypothetical protein
MTRIPQPPRDMSGRLLRPGFNDIPDLRYLLWVLMISWFIVRICYSFVHKDLEVSVTAVLPEERCLSMPAPSRSRFPEPGEASTCIPGASRIASTPCRGVPRTERTTIGVSLSCAAMYFTRRCRQGQAMLRSTNEHTSAPMPRSPRSEKRDLPYPGVLKIRRRPAYLSSSSITRRIFRLSISFPPVSVWSFKQCVPEDPEGRCGVQDDWRSFIEVESSRVVPFQRNRCRSENVPQRRTCTR